MQGGVGEPMSKLKAAAFSVSLDGFGAGLEQDLENPMGIGGGGLHMWFRPTATFHKMTGREGGSTGVDNDFAVKSFENIGAWIMGRNMFGPVRGPWPKDEWKGWWGDEPPYHVPVFVLTHHARPDLVMEGGTTFHFVTDGPEAALARAREAARGKDIRVGGGVSTLRQYLVMKAMDEVHLAFSPVLLGAGESLFGGLDLAKLGYVVSEKQAGEGAYHVVIRRQA